MYIKAGAYTQHNTGNELGSSTLVLPLAQSQALSI